MEKFVQTKLYNLEASVVDKENKCIRVPVNIPPGNNKNWSEGNKNWIDLLSLQDDISSKLEVRYPELKFTSKCCITKGEGNTEEFIFYFE